MTGGMPSTAAVAASQQASDYQMSQMTDKIPELQQLAYSMYQDKLSGDRADLNTLIGLEDNNYNRWLTDRNYLYQLARDQVGDQQTADALAYQKQQDKLNYDYQKERDAIEDARYNAEWQYKLQQAAQEAAGKASGTRRSNNVTAPPREADYDGLFEAAYQSGYRLIEALLVRLRVLVQVGGDVPRHGLLCSLVYDDLTPFHLLRGSPCLPRLCREGACRDQHLILAAALPGL